MFPAVAASCHATKASLDIELPYYTSAMHFVLLYSVH